MNKFISFTAKIFCIFFILMVTEISLANPASEQKTIIYVDLDKDAKKAHNQLKVLKKMDLLGINLKKKLGQAFGNRG